MNKECIKKRTKSPPEEDYKALPKISWQPISEKRDEREDILTTSKDIA